MDPWSGAGLLCGGSRKYPGGPEQTAVALSVPHGALHCQDRCVDAVTGSPSLHSCSIDGNICGCYQHPGWHKFSSSTGGHFVCKTFDLFTPFSVGLVYLLYLCFERISLFKPVTSRPANSERSVQTLNHRCRVCARISEHFESWVPWTFD